MFGDTANGGRVSLTQKKVNQRKHKILKKKRENEVGMCLFLRYCCLTDIINHYIIMLISIIIC